MSRFIHSGSSYSTAARTFILAACFLLWFSVPALADGGDGSELVSIINGTRNGFATLLKVVLLISASGAFVFAAYQLMSGNKEAAKRMILWIVGLAIGYLVIGALQKSSAGGAGGGTGDFGGFKLLVKGVIQSLLCIVAMFTVVKAVISVIHGEQGASRNLFKWFVVVMVGFTLVSAV